MTQQKRKTLKNFFERGSLPSQDQFSDLIDSMTNIIDDGFDKTPEEGLKVAQIGDHERLISFYRNIELQNPIWTVQVDRIKDRLVFNNQANKSILSLDPEGKIGVGLNNKDPETEFDVHGVISSTGRVGNYTKGKVPADGKWHSIVNRLKGCHAFEIMAGVGKKDSGKYALLHAYALNAFNPKGLFFNLFNLKKRIRCHQAYYLSRCCKLKLRWAGGPNNYALELKTRSCYGEGVKIQYHVTRLWFDELMLGCE